MKRFLLLPILLAGCATGASLEAESRAMRTQLDTARQAGAYRCSPRDLATAETQLEFLDNELEQGNSVRATSHRDLAQKALATVITKAKGCKPDAPPDRDTDGVPDENDACPDQRGTAAMLGCPDRDGDGIADNVDRCPDEPEDKDGFEDDDGCPEAGPIADRDNDKIPDGKDRCPDAPEDYDEFEDEDGCPEQDNDKDGVLDGDNRCPTQPETKNGYQDDDGCPDQKLDLVEVRRDLGKIEIKQKVFFDTGKATIKVQSNQLLDQVAEAMRQNPELKVLVEGHTDSVGSDEKNLKLSDARADSVRLYLLGKGVDSLRLTSQGFGETKPLESNKSARGREVNRRVEFTIVPE